MVCCWQHARAGMTMTTCMQCQLQSSGQRCMASPLCLFDACCNMPWRHQAAPALQTFLTVQAPVQSGCHEQHASCPAVSAASSAGRHVHAHTVAAVLMLMLKAAVRLSWQIAGCLAAVGSGQACTALLGNMEHRCCIATLMLDTVQCHENAIEPWPESSALSCPVCFTTEPIPAPQMGAGCCLSAGSQSIWYGQCCQWSCRCVGQSRRTRTPAHPHHACSLWGPASLIAAQQRPPFRRQAPASRYRLQSSAPSACCSAASLCCRQPLSLTSSQVYRPCCHRSRQCASSRCSSSSSSQPGWPSCRGSWKHPNHGSLLLARARRKAAPVDGVAIPAQHHFDHGQGLHDKRIWVIQEAADSSTMFDDYDGSRLLRHPATCSLCFYIGCINAICACSDCPLWGQAPWQKNIKSQQSIGSAMQHCETFSNGI